MKLLNVYHRDARNAGDLASSPLRYFKYDCSYEEAGAASQKEVWKADYLIVGGGGLICNQTFEKAIDNALQAVDGPKVLWGAGFNQHSYPFGFTRGLNGISGMKAEIRGLLRQIGLRDKSSWHKALLQDAEQYPSLDSRYDLIGVRDWGTKYRWVPCASCMHPIFDAAKKTSPTQKMVIVDHPMFFKINTRYKNKISNLNETFEKIISILTNAEIILTSSYHAAYWGVLLGRRVVAVPWSTKFLRFRWPIQLAFDLDGVNSAIRKSVPFYNALDEARSANMSFANDVSKLFSIDFERYIDR
jgi:hypothetical protein